MARAWAAASRFIVTFLSHALHFGVECSKRKYLTPGSAMYLSSQLFDIFQPLTSLPGGNITKRRSLLRMKQWIVDPSSTTMAKYGEQGMRQGNMWGK